jgi:diguanylate cyclase (GGDEF)-like protein
MIITVTSGDDERLLRTIIDVQRAINNAEPAANAVMRIIADQALAATHATGAVVELAEDDELVYTVAAGSLKGIEGMRLALDGSLSGLSVRTGQVLVSQDTDADSRVDREACHRANARSIICVPLRHTHRTEGVLQVMSDRPQAFDEGDVLILEQLAEFIATALRRAAIMDERERAASTDGLTGLANRQAFLAGLDRAIATASTGMHVAAVLYFDLDGFKPINDAYGHAVGDEVLREVGHRVAAECRAPDMAARIGGDEFAMLLIDSEHRNIVDRRDDLMTLVSGQIPTRAGLMRIDVSCGMAIVSGADLAESVLVRADAAMYAAKRSKYGAGGSRRRFRSSR